MLKVKDVIEYLEKIAPKCYAETNDPIGLQIGDLEKDIKVLAVALDASTASVKKAVEINADLLVTHHPLIYNPIKTLAPDNPIANRVKELIKADISFYAMHTNFDSAPGGIGDVLAEKLGIINTKIMHKTHTPTLYKLVAFVPSEHIEQVLDALTSAGAGHIGKYSHCTFRTEGKGTFKALEGANPFRGKVGRIEDINEYRIETICTKDNLQKVIQAMLKVHPYEEVAYDVYELKNEIPFNGLGIIGNLPEPMKLSDLREHLRKSLGIEWVKMWGDGEKIISKVGLGPGGAGFLYPEAAAAGCEVLITGDTKHSDCLDAESLGVAILDAGHLETEQPGMIALFKKMKIDFADSGMEIQYLYSI